MLTFHLFFEAKMQGSIDLRNTLDKIYVSPTLLNCLAKILDGNETSFYVLTKMSKCHFNLAQNIHVKAQSHDNQRAKKFDYSIKVKDDPKDFYFKCHFD